MVSGVVGVERTVSFFLSSSSRSFFSKKKTPTFFPSFLISNQQQQHTHTHTHAQKVRLALPGARQGRPGQLPVRPRCARHQGQGRDDRDRFLFEQLLQGRRRRRRGREREEKGRFRRPNRLRDQGAARRRSRWGRGRRGPRRGGARSCALFDGAGKEREDMFFF